MPDEKIDISHVVGATAGVFMDPYREFVERLHAVGRVSDEELMELRRELESRIPRLAEQTKRRLAELEDED